MATFRSGPNPLVSVVIPVYNCERYLAEAISSVLTQTYRPLEIIVVDDGSTDNSAAVARGFAEVKCCQTETNGGISVARNMGVGLSQGDLLSFLDADDLWPAEKISWQVEALAEDPSREIIFGHVEQFRSPELPPIPGDQTIFPPMPGYFASAMLIAKSKFTQVGLFSPAYRVAEFVDWYARAQEAGLRSHMLSQVVLKRRIHQTNIGIRERHARVDFARVLQAALSRRRASQRSR